MFRHATNIVTMQSQFSAWYLDDAVVAGNPKDVSSDLRSIVAVQEAYGLELNLTKCELFSLGGTEVEKMALLADFHSVSCAISSPTMDAFTLLGAGIPNEAVPECFVGDFPLKDYDDPFIENKCPSSILLVT